MLAFVFGFGQSPIGTSTDSLARLARFRDFGVRGGATRAPRRAKGLLRAGSHAVTTALGSFIGASTQRNRWKGALVGSAIGARAGY